MGQIRSHRTIPERKNPEARTESEHIVPIFTLYVVWDVLSFYVP